MNENMMILSEADNVAVALTDWSAGETHAGCCQTNANQSTKGRRACYLSRAKTAPFGESGGAVRLEDFPAGKTAFLIEVVGDGRCGRLQISADFASGGIGASLAPVVGTAGVSSPPCCWPTDPSPAAHRQAGFL